MVRVTPVAVAVAALLGTTVVPLVTLAMVAPAGIPAPVTKEPTSALVNAAVADVTVVFVLVAPSVTKRLYLITLPAWGMRPVMLAPALPCRSALSTALRIWLTIMTCEAPRASLERIDRKSVV